MKVGKSTKILGEISSNGPNDLLGSDVFNTVQSCWWSLLIIWPCINTTSVIFKWGTILSFSFLVILLLMLPSNLLVSGVKSLR